MLKTLTPTLTLIVPDANPLTGDDVSAVASLPRLARLAGRGSVSKRAIEASQDSLQAAILAALQLRDAAENYRGAPVMRAGISGELATGFWLRAQPIHFAAGLDRVTMVPLRGSARMSAAERQQLSPTFTDHLQSTGFELHDGADGEWLLRAPAPLQVRTVGPAFAAANPRDEILPGGRDAGGLRRLMTELQMLLHEHPVNTRRQVRGMPLLNAIWIHGEGMSSDVRARPLPAAHGDDVYLRGIYLMQGQSVQAKPVDAAALLAQVTGPTVAVVDVPDLEALDSRWLAPLSRALLGGAIAKLTVMFEGWDVSTARGAMFKFWRRDLPPVQWAAC